MLVTNFNWSFYISEVALSSNVRRIFDRRGGRRVASNLEREIKTRWGRWRPKTSSLLRFSPFFCPDLGEDQKKGLIPFFCSDFLPKFQRRGHGSILRTILRYSYITGYPKGDMAQWPPPKYAHGSQCLAKCQLLNVTFLHFGSTFYS